MTDTASQLGNRVPGWARVITAMIGVALTAAGAVAVFVTNNSTGAASLVVAGVVVGALAMFANLIQSLKAGEFEIVLATVAELTKAARDAERDGQGDVAEALRDQADLLLSAAEPFASQFEKLRRDLPPGRERTGLLEALVAQARRPADSYSAEAVEKLFDSGGEGERIVAIAIMQRRPDIASARCVTSALLSPRSRFEKYHALLVVEEMAKHAPESPQVAELYGVITDLVQAGGFADGSDSRRLADRILSKRLI